MVSVRTLRHSRLLAALAVVVLLRVSPATAGTVRGVLWNVPAPAEHHAPNPYPGQLSSLPGAGQGEAGGSAAPDAVVYLLGKGTEPGRANGRSHPVLDQVNQCFEPRVLGFPVGTSVDFLNSDRIYHNVFSYSSAKRFDLGKYPRGQKRTVVFDKPGLVKVFCDIHSNMSAFLLVVPTRFVTSVSPDGSFLLWDVPQGTYEIHAWNPEAGEIQRSIAVPDSGYAEIEMTY